ncbi:MAG: efflux RND transporter periplasmic adaptor subunit, partial [Spirochaetota bacterium]
VTQVGPIAAATGQYFPITISIVNDGRLLAGMTAKASLTLTSSTGIVVPPAAVQNVEGKSFAFVVGQDAKVSRRRVELGIRNSDGVIVISGIEPGETVAVSNLGMLVDGTEVGR